MMIRYAVQAWLFKDREGVQSFEGFVEAPDPDGACWLFVSGILAETRADREDIQIQRCVPAPKRRPENVH